MDLPELPPIGANLAPALWTELCKAAVYSARTSGTRVWRDSNMPLGVLGAGVDLATLEDSSGNRCVVENFSRELNLTSTGLNGWDGGAIAADMWIYLWLIANDPEARRIASQWAFLGSASHTAPSLPSGWTHKRLVSAVRTESDGGSGWSLVPFRHARNKYEFSGRRLVAEYTAARTKAAQSLAAAVPPMIDLADIALLSVATSGNFVTEVYTSGQSNPVWSAKAYLNKHGEDAGPIYCPGQSVDTATTTTGAGSGSVYVTGFRWPEGAEP